MDELLRDRWLAHASQSITAAGLRSGAVRTAVVETLAREGQCLLSAVDIADLLRQDGRGSIASVYRVLEELSELGLLSRMDGGKDGVSRYEIADPEHHHHHFVDEDTGEVQAFSDDTLEQAIERVAHRLGATLTGHDVILRGRKTPAGARRP